MPGAEPEPEPSRRPIKSGEEFPTVQDNRPTAPVATDQETPQVDAYAGDTAAASGAPVQDDVEQQDSPASPKDPPQESSAPPATVPRSTSGNGGGGGKPPGGGSGGGGGDDGSEEDEEEMVKMSFLDHLEELRRRIVYSVIAIAVAFFICWGFSGMIYEYMSEPVRQVLVEMGLEDRLYYTKPTDAFMLYLNLALVAGLFLASPFVLYQVWAFISPGLYHKERRYAVPFVFSCSALFIGGGLFGYFIAFPFALKFLLTFGGDKVTPWITINEYADLFWTVILGLGIVFELPVLMMFLGLLGIVTPGFLLRNFRYAVLLIFVVAAILTPTPDIINLMVFATPMVALYMVGVGLVFIVTRGRTRRTRWS
jgi:sec-independent protein translocase protein TatC